MNKILIVSALLFSHGLWSQEWQTDLKMALHEANSTDKKVLLFFTVPEFCDSCQILEKNVLASEEFKKFAAENFVLAKANFNDSNPASLEENLLIVEKYNKDGFFPHVVIIDKTSRIIGNAGVYNNESPATYIRLLQSIVR